MRKPIRTNRRKKQAGRRRADRRRRGCCRFRRGLEGGGEIVINRQWQTFVHTASPASDGRRRLSPATSPAGAPLPHRFRTAAPQHQETSPWTATSPSFTSDWSAATSSAPSC
ncbi:MAG: hypothetical protein MZU91_08065 [Desulfosudis oleivorans]|nr:hypothetical protein [Desulfosudis oleivorans]